MRYTGRKGWQASEQDTWDLDTALCPIILAGLMRFRKELLLRGDSLGTPLGIYEALYGDIPVDATACEAKSKEARAYFMYVVEQAMFAFDLKAIEAKEDAICSHSSPDMSKEVASAIRLELAALYQKVKEGRLLFAKHLSDFWI